MKKDHDRTWGYIYFISNGDAIKIGWTKNVIARLADLQTPFSTPLTLLATVSAPRSNEDLMHNRFSHLRIRGEWFKTDAVITDYIANLRRMNLVIDTMNTVRNNERSGSDAGIRKCSVSCDCPLPVSEQSRVGFQGGSRHPRRVGTQEDEMEARMDGTPEQQLRWRVSALREAMSEALSMDHAGTMQQVIRNGLAVDDYNAETMKRYMPQTEDEAAELMDNGRNTGGGKMRR